MKLGGRVLTVTQATPDVSSVENHGEQPSYGTPLHARPLLETHIQVLKLTNVLDPHSLSTLSEPELEEILEDILLKIHMVCFYTMRGNR
ncbi:Nucleotide-binding, alpha-beta plait [Artemisia annua]|uniref:Nucleotide-binding, alpha-beta plait n=1 Tax=Artemisia annua TaxID=35608 RepID=A0A2U1KT27_ARTAN|nr:Nucleotide-binding, alpha-beta plait [Artemisia annua]